MRGEYLIKLTDKQKRTELPPRARRIHPKRKPMMRCAGTTSACAENTWTRPRPWPNTWNYLRVRGEYLIKLTDKQKRTELPPRARRIHPKRKPMMRCAGTTSACAENTWTRPRPWPNTWNYLRVRGEYMMLNRCGYGTKELPPRARRIPHFGGRHEIYAGTTSACAENTNKTPKGN